MKITVIGCGRWGTFIAWYLDKIGHSVSLYGRKSSAHMQKLIETRTNGLVELPETLHLTNSLDAVKDSDVIVISVNSQGLRGLMRELQPFELKNKIFVLCMKGVEIETGMRLSQVCAAECDSSNAVAVWVGPGHVQEFAAGVPNCMVIDSDSEDAKRRWWNHSAATSFAFTTDRTSSAMRSVRRRRMSSALLPVCWTASGFRR